MIIRAMVEFGQEGYGAMRTLVMSESLFDGLKPAINSTQIRPRTAKLPRRKPLAAATACRAPVSAALNVV